MWYSFSLNYVNKAYFLSLKKEIIMVGTQMQDMGKDYMYC